jgi:hypothetical protein
MKKEIARLRKVWQKAKSIRRGDGYFRFIQDLFPGSEKYSNAKTDAEDYDLCLHEQTLFFP